MKYIIMMFGDQSGLEDKSKEWIMEMIELMHKVDADLRASGELVYEQGLADATQAKSIAFKNGMPAVTDGPFAESKESLAGFWVVDVESEARAIEIATGIVAFTEGPIEVRQCMDAPPEM